MKWEVLDNTPLPEEPGEGMAHPQWRRWWPWLLLLSLLATGAGGLHHLARSNEARLRADLASVVALEEQARHAGNPVQANALADPDAPPAWLLRYEALFFQPSGGGTLPHLRQVEFEREVALVTLDFPEEEAGRQEVRAYRLVGREWRRTPVPEGRWGEATSYHSPHFTLWMSERDSQHLPPDQLLAQLEAFRAEFGALWPIAERSVGVHVEPQEWSPPTGYEGGRQPQLRLGSPLLPSQGYEQLPSSLAAYRLALVAEVAGALDDHARRDGAEAEATRAILRDALVRHLLLTEEEQRAYRAALRLQSGPGQERVGAGMDRRGRIFLADYLIASEGPDAPARLAAALAQSTTLEAATVQAFGLALDSLRAEIALWREAVEGAEEQGVVTVLRVLEADPLRVLGVVDGALVTLDLAPPVPPLPVALPCLGTGSELVFHATASDGATLAAAGTRLRSLRLPTWWAAGPPEGADTVVVRHEGANTTRVLALDSQSGREEELLSLPGEVELVARADGLAAAFLVRDRCGLSVNLYDLRSGAVTRALVNEQRGESHLFWLDQQLYLLQDFTVAPGPPYWLFLPIQGWTAGEPRTMTVEEGDAWGSYLGFDSKAERHLAQLKDGRLYQFEFPPPLTSSYMPAPPALLPLPEGAALRAYRADAGWLVYSERDQADGASFLYLFELATRHAYLLHRSPPDMGYRDVALGQGTPPSVMAALVGGAAGQDSQLRLFIFPTPPDTPPLSDTAFIAGTIDDLHWCEDGRLLYHLTHEGTTTLAEGFRGQPRPFRRADDVLACLTVK